MLKSFKEFVDQKAVEKPWTAKKSDVMQSWNNLKPNLPLNMQPVSEHNKGSRFRYDGIRVTGTAQFINGIMSRIKDMMQYENEVHRLDIEYRQIPSKEGDMDNSPQFAFYCHLVKKDDSQPLI